MTRSSFSLIAQSMLDMQVGKLPQKHNRRRGGGGRRRKRIIIVIIIIIVIVISIAIPQWGAADEEVKVRSGENTELKGSPLKAWSRSVYSHTCYSYCQRFLPCLFLSFRSIHLHFFQNLSQFFSCVGCG